MGKKLYNELSINTEILRFYHKPDPQHTLKVIIFQQVLTVTVIILKEKILVLVIVKLIT